MLKEVIALQVNFIKDSTDDWKIEQEGDEQKELKLQGLLEDEKANIDNIRKIIPFFSQSRVAFKDVETSVENLTLNKVFAYITITNVDNFVYRIKVGTQIDDYTMCNITVTGPKEMSPALQEKLQQEQSIQKWTYLLPNANLSGLLQHRSSMVMKKIRNEHK